MTSCKASVTDVTEPITHIMGVESWRETKSPADLEALLRYATGWPAGKTRILGRQPGFRYESAETGRG
jgi:hypothetical protein